MKHEWRKHEKEFYLPKESPETIIIPKQLYFTIDGRGNPNNKPFTDKVEALYALSYAIRMMPKQGYTPDGYFEYTVYPLEGIWDLAHGKTEEETLHKDDLIYTIMIRQPAFVTEEITQKALEQVQKKKPTLQVNSICLKTIEDGRSVQMLHTGSYDDEHLSFSRMKAFIESRGLKRTKTAHREIYLSDPRKTEDSKMKTVLRYTIEPE